MATNGKKEAQGSKKTDQLQPTYRAVRLDTEDGVMSAINDVYAGLASGKANLDQSKQMLSAVGKSLNLQNLKARIGLHKAGKFGFFLTA